MNRHIFILALFACLDYQSYAQANVPPGVSPSDSSNVGESTAPVQAVARDTVELLDQDLFRNLPARGVVSVVALQPGIVIQGANAAGEPAIFVRGGRSDVTGYYLEGFPVADVLFGGMGINIPAEALEAISIRPDGRTVDHDGSAGSVQMQMRTGSASAWGGSLIAETDRFTTMNKSALGAYSYGYSDWTGTIGGPMPGTGGALRLFGFAQNTFYRDPTVSVRSGWDFSGANAVIAPTLTTVRSDTLNLVSRGGNAPGGLDNRWSFGGSALLDASPARIRLAGSYSVDRSREAATFVNMLNLSRLPLSIERDGAMSAKLSVTASPSLSLEAGLDYFARTFVSEDPDLLGNVFAYGDPAANAAFGYNLPVTNGQSANLYPYQLWGGLGITLNQPGTQIAGFERDKQQSFGGHAALALRLGAHDLGFGVEYTQYTIRRYAPSNVFNWWNLSKASPTPSALETRLILDTGSDSYGYDIWGNEISGDDVRRDTIYYLGPRHPVFAGGYLQDNIALGDVSLQIGLRYDYIDPDSRDEPSTTTDGRFGLIPVWEVAPTPTTSRVSPRLCLTFSPARNLLCHVRYGRYIQERALAESYLGTGLMAQLQRFASPPFNWGVRPTETTMEEAGVSYAIGDFGNLDVTAFYREDQDRIPEIELASVLPIAEWIIAAPGWPMTGGTDQALTTAKGISVAFSIRRQHRFAAKLNCTVENVQGTEIALPVVPGNLPIYWIPATTDAHPLDFNQPLRGSIQLDYRFGREDGGPVLEQSGLDLLMTFNSGHSYTMLEGYQLNPFSWAPAGPIGGSTTPWFFQLDARLDKAFQWGPGTVDLYIYVINLLGTDNPVNVFPFSGDPSNDGFLSTPSGRDIVQTYGQQFASFYNAVYTGKNSGNWGPPRQIRFGARLDL